MMERGRGGSSGKNFFGISLFRSSVAPPPKRALRLIEIHALGERVCVSPCPELCNRRASLSDTRCPVKLRTVLSLVETING